MFRSLLILSLSLFLAGQAYAVSYTTNNCRISTVAWENSTSGGCVSGTGGSIGLLTALCGTQTYYFTIANDAQQKMAMYHHAIGTSNLRIYYNGVSGAQGCQTNGSTTDCRCNYGVYLYRFGN